MTISSKNNGTKNAFNKNLRNLSLTRDKSSKVELLKEAKRSKIEPKLEYAINLFSSLKALILEGATTTKIMVLSSIFPEKIEFDGEKYRTKNYNKVLDLIYQETKVLRGEQNKKRGNHQIPPLRYPEPIHNRAFKRKQVNLKAKIINTLKYMYFHLIS